MKPVDILTTVLGFSRVCVLYIIKRINASDLHCFICDFNERLFGLLFASFGVEIGTHFLHFVSNYYFCIQVVASLTTFHMTLKYAIFGYLKLKLHNLRENKAQPFVSQHICM